jgi:putative protease
MVKGYDMNRKLLILEQRNFFSPGDTLEVFTPGKDIIQFKVKEIFDGDFVSLDAARHPLQTIMVNLEVEVPEYSLVRRVKNE